MKNKQIIRVGIVLIALLCIMGTVAALDDNSAGAEDMGDYSEDIAPYNGPIGADSPLHGLKIAMENLDETFTFNDTQRVEKQVDHARLRIAEVRRELDFNRTNTAERVLELYWEKLNMTERSLTPFASNATGLLHAQEMIARHQTVLANLSLQYPNNTGLARAYNNSLFLEQKFEQKTEMKFARFVEKNNNTIFKAVKLEISRQNRTPDDTNSAKKTTDQGRNKIQERITEQHEGMEINETITPRSSQKDNTPSIQKKNKDSKDQG
ncbi:MAG: DUF5667 domain-containing protein [Methanoregula sp.]|nr:DUF5667 domain-containing protein [Methanoregula sp.]